MLTRCLCVARLSLSHTDLHTPSDGSFDWLESYLRADGVNVRAVHVHAAKTRTHTRTYTRSAAKTRTRSHTR